MNVKGGEQFIDFKHTSITVGTAVSIPGTHSALEGNYHKVVILANVVIGGIEYNNIIINMISTTTGICGILVLPSTDGTAIVKYMVTVSDADEITISVIA